MCVIIHASDKSQLDWVKLESLSKAHPDGVGIMFLNDQREVVMMKHEKSSHYADILQQLPDGVEFGLHFRWCTSGPVCHANAHPHKVPGGALMHNGHLSGFGMADKSDTAHFAMLLSELWAEHGTHPTEYVDAYASGQRFLYLDAMTGFSKYGDWMEHYESQDGFISYSSDSNATDYEDYTAYRGSWNDEEYMRQWRDDSFNDLLAPWTDAGMGVLDWVKSHPEDAADYLEQLWMERDGTFAEEC